MALGVKLIRYFLIAINVLFVLCGIALITVGALGTRKDMTHFLDHKYLTAPIICIVVGCIMFVVAAFGFFGAWKYNHYMVVAFAVLVFILMIIELGGGIAMHLYGEKAGEFLKKNMDVSLKQHKNESLKVWDVMQSRLECCGVEGPADYVTHNFHIPNSCCKHKGHNATCTEADAFKDGCYPQLRKTVHKHIIIIFGVAIGFAIVELLIVIFALFLAHAIRKESETY